MALLVKAFIKFLQFIPYSLLHKFGSLMALFLNLLPNSHKKNTQQNLKLVFPDKSSKDIKTLIKKSLFHSSMNFLESGIVWGSKNTKFENYLVEVFNKEAINKSFDSDRGILLITPHLGNIEIIIKFLGKQFNCTIPYSKPNQSYLDKIITLSRESAGVKMVHPDSAGLKVLIKSLKEKNMVAIASDQVPKKGFGIASTFFGKEIYSMTLVPKLKKVSNCAVHSVYCERRKKAQGFNIYFSDEIDLSHDVQEGVDRMNNEFEECIMTIPEQYSWEYKKFKRSVNKTIYNQ